VDYARTSGTTREPTMPAFGSQGRRQIAGIEAHLGSAGWGRTDRGRTSGLRASLAEVADRMTA